MWRGSVAFVLAAWAAPAMAGDAPRYERVPAWVLPAPAPAASGEGGPLLQIVDQQSRIVDGSAWSYNEAASRALSADALARMGTVSLSWQPFHGDLIIHRVAIVREGERIDVLKGGQRFTVIRREQRLEQLEMDGRLTATLQVQGLRVGDVLDVAYSITARDATLRGGVQVGALAPSDPLKVGFARARFLWPSGAPMRWKAYPAGIVATESDTAGWHDLTFTLPAPKQPELPPDAPQRFRRLPAVEASSFAAWEDVSRVMAPLYDPHGKIAPGSPLAQEVARIAQAEADPRKRAAAALALVQDRVRYFANGMNGGNYLPQAPAQTWSAGYGDCKAKTLLLLAMLDALGIRAEPVLANIGQGDYVADRLPAPGAFNHIFVHAEVDGQDLWMDGTGRGTRIEDLGDPPPFRWVLPVRTGGATLLKLPARAPARPNRTIAVTIDSRAGIGLPSPFDATVTLRGGIADALRVAAAQMDREQLDKLAMLSLGGAAGPSAVAASAKFAFDPATATAVITLSGLTEPSWQRQDHRYRYRAPSAIAGATIGADRARAAWRDIPVATGTAEHMLTTTRVLLPEGGRQLVVEGDPLTDLDVAGRQVVRKTRLDDGVLTIEEDTRRSGAELAAADLPAARARLTSAQARLARLATATDYPPLHVQVARAKRDHRLDSLSAAYAAWIADKPDEVGRYVARGIYYETTVRWSDALADFDKAVAIDASEPNLLRRANLLENLGEKARAAADYKAVLALDPDSKRAVARLGLLQTDAGQGTAALGSIDEKIANAGEDKPDWLDVKAEMLARGGNADAALAALDQAIAIRPSNPILLNQRCWVKATLDVQLATALQDCTRSIELSDGNASALDSRALVYLRMHRLTEALADADAALEMRPDAPGSLFIRGIVERDRGDRQRAAADIADAKTLSPQILQEYARWKIVP